MKGGETSGVGDENKIEPRRHGPEPGGPKGRDENRFSFARRHVDDEVADVVIGQGLKVFGDAIDMPVRDERFRRRDDRPCLGDELRVRHPVALETKRDPLEKVLPVRRELDGLRERVSH